MVEKNDCCSGICNEILQLYKSDSHGIPGQPGKVCGQPWNFFLIL